MSLEAMRKQRGVTMIGWVIILSLIIGGALMFMKIFPIYSRNFSVQSSLKVVAKQSDIASQSPAKIVENVMKQFNVNSIYNFDKTDIKVQKTRNGVEIRAEYEVRENIAGNLDVVVSFDERVESGSQ
jgi:hypothetical protein